MQCRECKLFDIDAAKNKAGYIVRTRAVKCLWVSKEQYPISVSSALGHRPMTGFVRVDDGHRCPCFQKRVK